MRNCIEDTYFLSLLYRPLPLSPYVVLSTSCALQTVQDFAPPVEKYFFTFNFFRIKGLKLGD